MKLKKYRKWMAAVILLMLLILAACYTVFIQPQQDTEQYVYIEETVEFGNLVQGITETGSISLSAAAQTYELDLTTAEEDEDDEDEEEDSYLRIEEVYVVSGERIEAGAAVLKLTDKSISDVRRQLQSLQTEAEIALEEAKIEYETGILTASHTYQSSLLSQSTAETEYTITTTSLQKEIEKTTARISILEEEIRQIEAELADSWEDYDALREAYEEAEYAFERCDESTITKYITLRDAYLTAKQQYEATRDSRLEKRKQMADKQEEIAAIETEAAALLQKIERQNLDAKQSYETASLDGTLAAEIYNDTLEALQESVDSAQLELAEAQEKYQTFEEFVGDGTVYAQGGGLITEVNYEAGDYLVNEGIMFSYVQEGDYVISIDISEEDIPYVKVGDKVTIVFNAYEEEPYEGTITEITTSASSSYAATVSYPVTIQIKGDTTKLYGGMTGDVTFVTDQVEKTLYVSRRAIVEQNGRTYIYIDGNGEDKKLTEVTTGFTDGISVQIIDGLEQGDTIYIQSKAGTGGTFDDEKK